MPRHFDRSSLPHPRTFYERELGKLSRPDRKGWALGNCPFHRSKSGRSFSVNVDTGGFYCFGCGVKGGDVLAFLSKRDHLDFKRAAQVLGAWRDEMPADEQKRLKQLQEERQRHRDEQAVERENERQQRVHAATELRAAVTLYREAKAEHNFDLMSEMLPRVRQLEERYAKLAGLEVSHDW